MSQFKVGDRVEMPGVPYVVTVLEVLAGCEEDGCEEETFRFADPVTGEDDLMHSDEFWLVSS